MKLSVLSKRSLSPDEANGKPRKKFLPIIPPSIFSRDDAPGWPWSFMQPYKLHPFDLKVAESMTTAYCQVWHSHALFASGLQMPCRVEATPITT